MRSIDLTTDYLGLKLKSPWVASASPCTGQPDVLRTNGGVRGRRCGTAVLIRRTDRTGGCKDADARRPHGIPVPGDLQSRGGKLPTACGMRSAGSLDADHWKS